jgi:hypothetical protein
MPEDDGRCGTLDAYLQGEPMKPHWFPFYVERWRGSLWVRAMTAEQRGWFIQMLTEAWDYKLTGHLPNDPALLWMFAGAESRAAFEERGRIVMDRFKVTDDRAHIFSATLVEIYRDILARSEKQSENARKRWGKDAKAMPSHSDRNATGVLSTSTPTTKVETPEPSRATRADDAERVYSQYPRKVGKAAALKAIERAIQRVTRSNKCEVETAVIFLISRTYAFAQSPAGQRGEFTPHAATWFNQDRFNDNPEEWNRNGNGPVGPSRAQQRANRTNELAAAAEYAVGKTAVNNVPDVSRRTNRRADGDVHAPVIDVTD